MRVRSHRVRLKDDWTTVKQPHAFALPSRTILFKSGTYKDEGLLRAELRVFYTSFGSHLEEPDLFKGLGL